METFSTLLALCAGNSPVTGESPHKDRWRGALMFSLICAWINGWVNYREAGDLRRHSTHYDVTIMISRHPCLLAASVIPTWSNTSPCWWWTVTGRFCGCRRSSTTVPALSIWRTTPLMSKPVICVLGPGLMISLGWIYTSWVGWRYVLFPTAYLIWWLMCTPQTELVFFLNSSKSHDDVINENIFRVTGPLCGELTSYRWILLTKASHAELWCFLWSAPE